MTLPTPLSLTQLYDQHVHYSTTLWKFERTDGVTLLFTDHPEEVTFKGQVHSPAGGTSQTASQSQDGVKEANKSLKGPILDSSALTHEDLRTGRYRNCKVTEYKIDWRTPWLDEFYKNVYYIVEVSFDGQSFSAELAGVTTKLRQPIGRILSKNCDYRLGEALNESGVPGCKVDLSVMEVSGEVTTLAETYNQFGTDILNVLDSAGSSIANVDNWFKFGRLTFTSGDNINVPIEIRKSQVTNGEVYLTFNTANPIQIGDTFDIVPGCDKNLGTCRDKFDNLLNFGGNPDIPGTDSMIRSPNAK